MKTGKTLYFIYKHVVCITLSLRVIGFFADVPHTFAAESALQTEQLRASRQAANFFAPQDFLTLVNQARANADLPALAMNDQLDTAAMDKAIDMADKGYWDHFRPSDHKAPWDFIKDDGYDYSVAGENLAKGFSSPEGITEAWLDSPSHRANMLSAKYHDVGFASIESTSPEGKQVLLTVEMFGSR